MTALLRVEGWRVNPKRVQRIWRREGLKVPKKQPKRARLWLNDGSCIRLRPERKDHVWAYDFLHHCTHDGRALRLLTLVDEYTKECLAIDVERKLNSESVLERLGELFMHRGVPEHIRSDNGPEFTAAVSYATNCFIKRPISVQLDSIGTGICLLGHTSLQSVRPFPRLRPVPKLGSFEIDHKSAA